MGSAARDKLMLSPKSYSFARFRRQRGALAASWRPLSTTSLPNDQATSMCLEWGHPRVVRVMGLDGLNLNPKYEGAVHISECCLEAASNMLKIRTNGYRIKLP